MKRLMVIALISSILFQTSCSMNDIFVARQNSEKEENAVEVEDTGEIEEKPETNITSSGTVVRVKDGDTYVLDIGGKEKTVRLIGVDTPESVAPSDYYKDNTEEGKEISEIVKEKIQEGDTLLIEYDVQRTDDYGRTLAYLFFSDDEMVQEWLLTNGYANTMTIQPNSKYADYFSYLAHNAEENKIGLWNGFFEGE